MHHCNTNHILCINLTQILRALWELKILTQTDVRKVIIPILINKIPLGRFYEILTHPMLNVRGAMNCYKRVFVNENLLFRTEIETKDNLKFRTTEPIFK